MKKKPGRILPPEDFDKVPPKQAAITILSAFVLVLCIIGFTIWVID